MYALTTYVADKPLIRSVAAELLGIIGVEKKYIMYVIYDYIKMKARFFLGRFSLHQVNT